MNAVWQTVLVCEFRLLRRDAAAWLAVLVMVACVSYALITGHQRQLERAAAVAAAQQDESQRRAQLTAQARRIERGEAARPAEPHRDPTNPLAVGRGSGAAVAYLAAVPLVATAVGLADLYPPSFRVAAGSRDRFLFTDEIANPTLLAAGSFDLAFVVVVLLPLVLLALCYDVLSGEREQGTWALTLASSAPPLQVLLSKLAARAAGTVAALIGTAAIALAVQGSGLATAAGALAFCAWSVLVVLYAAFWLALAFWVNTFSRNSAFNAVALVLAWVALVLAAPAAINAIAEAAHPAPDRSEMVLAVRQAAVDADRDRDAERERFRAEHGAGAQGAQGADTAARDARALALLLQADRRADEVLARHDAAVRANRRLAERLSWLAPPVLVNDGLAALAGSGPDRWDAHLADVDGFHQSWQAYFVGFAERRQALGSADHLNFPKFEAANLALWSGAAALRVAAAMFVLAVLAGSLVAAGARRLRAA